MLTLVDKIETEETLARMLTSDLEKRGVEGVVRVRWGPDEDPVTTVQIGPRRVRVALWSFAPSRATWKAWVADIATHCLGVSSPRQARAA